MNNSSIVNPFHEDDSDGSSDCYDDEPDYRGDKLDISEELARKNYNMAGTEKVEDDDQISIAGNAALMSDVVDRMIDEVTNKLDLPYSLSEFQRVSINVLGSKKNLILVSPTGSGKTDVPYLSVLVLRELEQNPKGVCIVTQPLTSIMNEKLASTRICPVATLSMTGKLKTGTVSAEEEDCASLSCSLEDLLDGKFPILMGHPESFDSSLGQHILRYGIYTFSWQVGKAFSEKCGGGGEHYW